MEDLFHREATFSYRDVEDSASYVEGLRSKSQSESSEAFSEAFLEQIVAWQDSLGAQS